jgi:hypothetical protein
MKRCLNNLGRSKMQIKNIWLMTDRNGQVSINAQIEIGQHIFVKTVKILKGESIWAYAS